MEEALGHPLPAPQKPVTWWTHSRVIALALVGGILGIVGSFLSEVRTGGLLLLPLGAPIIEEAFKPIGVYLGFVRWPAALTNRWYVALLCAGAGIVFGLVESTMYVFVYARDQGGWYPYFRYTVPVALHAVASFTVGLGLDRSIVDWMNRGALFPKRTRRFYLAGVTIHGIYNSLAVILTVTGVLDF